jgi:gliding motility-associated-like protein
VNVEKFIPATLSAGLGPYCWDNFPVLLSSIVANPGGVWSGPGVTGTGTLFDVSVSGPGDHVLTYSTFSSPTASLCPDASTVLVHVNPKPVADVNSNIAIACNPATILFTSPTVSNGSGIWNFGDGTVTVNGLSATHTYTSPGSYPVTFDYSDDIGCKAKGTLPYQIVIHPTPVANFNILPGGSEEISIAEPDVQFQNTSIGANSFYWNIANVIGTTETNPTYSFTQYGFAYVTLYATNEFGCTDTLIKLISIKNDYGFWVPNAFSPNDDGLNDVFRPIASKYGFEDEMKSYEFDIFDRWGEKMFSTRDFLTGWNGAKFNKGEVAKNDIYVWKIRYKDATGKAHYITGHVTLIK